MLARAGEQGLK